MPGSRSGAVTMPTLPAGSRSDREGGVPRPSEASLLLIARELEHGGASYLLLRHLAVLAPRYARIDVLITGPIAPDLTARLPANATLHSLAFPDPHDLLTLRVTLDALRHPCLERSYDALLATSLFPDAVACVAFAWARAKRRVLVLLDEGPILARLEPHVVAAIRGAMNAADAFAPVSAALLGRLARAYPMLRDAPATVLFPPIDPPGPPAPAPFPSGARRIVTVARLTPDKQVLACLSAHRALRDAGLDVHWHVIGEGPQRPRLELDIALARMGDRFHLEGFVPDARRWLRHADLSVLLSRSEGCPTVVREAIAEGTPVLCSDVSGARELLGAGDDAFGIVVDDDPAAYVAALRYLLTDPHALARYRAALARVPHPPDVDGDALAALLAAPPRPRPARVGVMIPTFLQAERIATAIHGALMQDTRDLEVIVADDASPDATAAVAARFTRDPRCRLIRHEHNLGRVANYRALLDAARGAWVLMHDGDDHLIDPSFLTQALAAAEPDTVIVQAGHRVAYRTPRRGDVDVLPAIHAPVSSMSGADYLTFVYRTGFFSHLAALYRRDAALAQGFYQRDLASADMDSLLRLALTGRVTLLRRVVGCWCQHDANASAHLPLARIAENVRIFREIARSGAAAGRVDLRAIERPLRRHEARTIAHLLGAALAESPWRGGRPLAAVRVVVRVNPWLLLDPRIPLSIARHHLLRRIPRLYHVRDALRRGARAIRAWRA
jgi:glycosyltransferase involved in cell wall biosynthesis